MSKIGILLPRSTFYASMSFDIVEGFRAGLKHLQREDVEIVVENIGFGAEKQASYQAAENLLIKENVQIVVAYIGHKTAQLLRPLFMSANRLLIVLDSGSNMPQEWPVCPNIIYHSLNGSLACWLTAKNAFRDGVRKAGMVTCYYDGGYLHTLALTQSFVESGGQMVFNHATGYTPEGFSVKELNAHLEEYPEAALLCIFSADFTQWFFAGIEEHLHDKQPPIYASSFMLEESVLAQIPYSNRKVQGVVAWSKEITTEDNKQFLAEMLNSGREATIFSLLAWESVSLVLESLKLLDENQKKVPVVVQKLNGFQFQSPRGTIRFPGTCNYTISPMYEVKISADESGMSKLTLIQTIEDCQDEFDTMCQFDLDGVSSGWFNSYACI